MMVHRYGNEEQEAKEAANSIMIGFFNDIFDTVYELNHICILLEDGEAKGYVKEDDEERI